MSGAGKVSRGTWQLTSPDASCSGCGSETVSGRAQRRKTETQQPTYARMAYSDIESSFARSTTTRTSASDSRVTKGTDDNPGGL